MNILLLLALLGMFGLGVFEVVIALQGQQVLGLDPLQVGLIFMECSLVMAAVQVLVFSPPARHVGFRFIITPAFLLMAVGVWLLPLMADLDWLMLLVGLFAAGSGDTHPDAGVPVSLDAGAAMVLAWTGSTFEIITLASRAFALYYLLQCLVALSVCRNHLERARFFFVALALVFVLVFAVPAG